MSNEINFDGMIFGEREESQPHPDNAIIHVSPESEVEFLGYGMDDMPIFTGVTF